MKNPCYLLLAALLLLGNLSTFASGLSTDEALQIIKANRIAEGLSNTNVNFYFAEVDSLTNNYACTVDLSSINEQWASDSTPKWLFFVDEQPFRSWQHDCSYYYMQAEVSEDDLSILHFNGCFPPDCILSAIETNFMVDNSNLPALHFPERAQLSPGQQYNCTDSTYVVLAANGYFASNINFCYRDIRAVYQMLTRVYGIDKSHIRIAFATGIDAEGFTQPYREDSSIFINLDLDGDQENEVIEAAYNDLNRILLEMCDTSLFPKCKHLFVLNLNDLQREEDFPVNYSELNVGGNGLGYLNVYALGSSPIYTPSFNSVITTTSNYVFDNNDSLTCREPLLNWINALSGINILTGNPVNADGNQDGRISMAEAASYAEMNGGNVYCRSEQATLASALSLDHYPLSPMLTISDLNESNPEITWASTDIWIRNHDDGITNQESEHITTNGETKYIYVKVHNNSSVPYEGHGQKLYLYTTNHLPALSLGEPNVQSLSLVGVTTITSHIPPHSSSVVKFEINGMPGSANFDGVIIKDFFASTGYVSPGLEYTGFLATDILTRDQMAASKFSLINPGKCSASWTRTMPSGAVSIPFSGVEIPVLIPRCKSLEIVNTNSQKTSANSFSVAIRFSYHPDLQYTGFTPESDTEDTFLLSGNSGSLEGEYGASLIYDEELVYLKCFDRGVGESRDKDFEFSLIARDESEHIVGARTFSLHLDAVRWGDRFSITSTYDHQNGVNLTATNVSSQTAVRWLGTHNEILGDEVSLHVDAEDMQDTYVVQAKDTESGITRIASIDMTKANFINTALLADNSLNVSLWRPSNGTATIRVSSYDGQYTAEGTIANGLSDATVSCGSLPCGLYVVSLVVNDVIVDSKTIQKN